MNRPTGCRHFLAATAVALLGGLPAAAADFDLDALIAAAKAEPPITVYAVTGKIVETAEAFTKKYGVQATGKKVNEAGQIDLLTREAQAGNIQGDLSVAADVGAMMAELLPAGIVESWLPPDMADDIPAGEQSPLVVVSDPQIWSYNTETYDKCPVTNVWQLTRPEWKGKVTMVDPLLKAPYIDWFNQLETHHDAAMAAAYEAEFGKKLETDQKSATAAWVAAFAANGPLLADSDDVSKAIGVKGQKAPYFGITASAKYRGNTKGELSLGICAGMQPFAGFTYPGLAMIATGTDSPNAARLFTRYLLTEEGIAPQSVDGKMSSNRAIPPNPKEASGVAAYLDQLTPYDTSTAADDYDRRQDWGDLWRLHYAR